MRNIFSVVVGLVLLFIAAGQGFAKTGQTIDDRAALSGISSARGLFDINVSSADKLELYLSVILKTHDDLVRQGQKPEFVVAFRGASVRLINSATWTFSEDDQKKLATSAGLIKQLHARGVTLEACSIATELFRVDNETILPGITVVGNTFVSLIGYQAKGYALVPIQ